MSGTQWSPLSTSFDSRCAETATQQNLHCGSVSIHPLRPHPGVRVHAHNSSTLEIETGKWTQVPGHPGQHIEALSQRLQN